MYVERFELEMDFIQGFSELPLIILPSDTPSWFQRKLATLLSFPCEPPTTYVPKLGRRITENVFWIECNGEDYGDDTGKESKG